MIKTYTEIVAETQKYISTVSVEEAVQKIRNTTDSLDLDVCHPKAHEEDSYTHYKHIPLDVLELKVSKLSATVSKISGLIFAKCVASSKMANPVDFAIVVGFSPSTIE